METDASNIRLFAVCAPGLEPYLAGELGLPPSAAVPGGVEFSGGLEQIYQANLALRTATRLLLRLGSFRAEAFWELRKKAARLPWERCLAPGQPLALRVTCHKSRLYHSDAVAERIAGAVADRLGQPSPTSKAVEEADEQPEQLVVVRLADDVCQVSIDSSGAALHRRGYRLQTAKAPLRETLAAGMLLASGWDGAAPLIDPFCGSGTIPIEAALLGRKIAPGLQRNFAFMHWPDFDASLWDRLCQHAGGEKLQDGPAGMAPVALQASDRDAGAIQASRANAARAGVADCIEFACQAVSAIHPRGRGWVVTNPPYGLRVSANQDLRSLYAQFGKVLRQRCRGWRVLLICPEMRLLAQSGLEFKVLGRLYNGGVQVLLAAADV